MVRALRNNRDSANGTESHFTPSRATEMLPLVRRIVSDLVSLNQSIEAQREQIKNIDRLPETIEHVDYQEELRDIRGSLDADVQRMESCLSELSALGVVPHLPIDGTIDFPTIMNRRPVRLCWNPNDDRVEYWHEVGQSSEERQQIEHQSFGAESLN